MKYLFLLPSGGILLALLISIAGCENETQEAPERLRPVKSIVVHAGTNALRDRMFTGTAKAAQASRISFNVSGTVKQLPVSIGDTLAAGQLIAALDPATYDVEVQRAQASLAQANAEGRNVEAEYQRVRQLFANSNASRNDLDSALSRTESAKANVKAISQSLRLAKLNRSYTHLTADKECSIASLDIELNENVTAGTQVAIINCGNKWEVEIAVAESLIAAFKPEMLGVVRFNAITNHAFTGAVSEVGITGGSSTTYPVTLTLNEQHSAFRSGLAADVTFAFAGTTSDETTMFLPPAAVGQDEQGAFVYVLESSESPDISVTKRRGVVVGALSSSGLAITAGLNDGDRVVTAGITAARDGLHVLAN